MDELTETSGLAESLEKFAVRVDQAAIPKLEAYCRSVWDWNTRLNLTRHTTFDQFVSRDVVDTLALANHLSDGERILDAGSGAGVPGVTLALLRPDLEVTLTESVGKRAAALAAIVAEIGLDLPVIHGRAEHVLEPHDRIDTITARAVAPLYKLVNWFGPLLRPPQRLLLIKGAAWVEERHEARQRGLLRELELRRLDEYAVPGVPGKSVILQVRRKDSAAES